MILEFDECRIPNSQVLGEVDGGFAVMNTWLYATRLTVATNCVGRARRVFDYALNYSSEREQFGQKIGKYSKVKVINPKIKLKKLKFGRKIVEWFGTKSNADLYSTKKIKGFKMIRLVDLKYIENF